MEHAVIRLKAGEKTPFYEQIYAYFAAAIRSGALAAGEKLPSKRRLAQDVGVSISTVETAYAMLVAEGYLEAKPRSGFRVCSLSALQRPVTPAPSPAEPVQTPPRFDFSTGRVDTTLFPFAAWRRLQRQVLAGDEAVLRAGCAQGDEALRQAIATHLAEFRGVLANCGATVAYVPVDAHGMQPAALAASGAALAYVTPSHQFPTGATMPVGRRTRLLQWAAQREGRFIIEDDYDSEFRLDGRPLPAMQSLGPQQVIYIGTFSRGIAPAVRIGYLVLPPALLSAFFSRFGFYSCTVGRIEQQTLCRFLETGQYARHQARLRAAYRRKRDAVCAALLEALAPFSPRIENAHTGLHFVLRLACPCTGKALAGAMRCHGVLACPLSAYFHTGRCSEAGPALVLGFGGLAQQDIRPAAQAMARAAEEACAQHG